MNKKTRKTAALLLALALSVAVLCSCDGDSTSSDPEDATSVNVADESGGGDENSEYDFTSSDMTETDQTVNSDASLWTSSDYSSSVQRTSSMASGNNQRASSTSSARKTSSSTSSKNTSSNSTTSVSYAKAVTLYVKDFGAVGNGVTDDGAAIYAAVQALRSSPPGSVLEFEKGKTYYYEDNGIAKSSSEMSYESYSLGRKHVSPKKYPYLFYLNGDSDLKIKGNGCLVKMGAYDTAYMYLENCNNITIEDFNLDYAVKPAFAAELIGEISIDNSTKTATALVKADRDITLKTGEEYVKADERPGRSFFGVIPMPTNMTHLFIKKYEMVDRAARTLRVYFDLADGTPNFLTDSTAIKQYGLTLPMPHNGFSMDGGPTDMGFAMYYDSNLTFKNINVYSNKYQTFYPIKCEGVITFENVNFVRAPYDQDLHFVSWGDLYHPTHCRAKFIWKNCTSEQAYDDEFNIFSVTMFVTKKKSNNVIELQSVDSWYGVPTVKVGDDLTIVDNETKKLIGKCTVREVVLQKTKSVTVRIDKSLAGVDIGENPTADNYRIMVWDENTICDPATEMIGCKMDGTYRVRSNVTFTNCVFNIRRFWIDLDAPYEGPLPHNLLFRGCTFTGDSGAVWEIHSFNNVNKTGYHIEDIVFENCKGISMDKISKDKYDQVTIK